MLVLVIVAVLIIVYIYPVRGWINTWGATESEVNATLFGDDILKVSQGQTTRAITIHAPATYIWQWLIQIGQGRGGFFSYDWLENLFGLDIHTIKEIVPAYQNLNVGDEIRFGKNGPIYLVAALEPQHALILRMPDQETRAFPDPNAPNYYDATWGFILRPMDANTTRLIIRGRGATNTRMGRLMNEIIAPITFIMEQKMLRTLKSLAESSVNAVVA